ncbi:MAG: ribonuclease J [Spirochaetes bacterium]|nr:MAG: ribonuclease J [Spirochaetota bacterium]
MKHSREQKLTIIPIGGLAAIGTNMTLFEFGDDIMVVDCGIMFPNEEMPGIDFIIPDFSYVVKNRSRVKGVIITHGHEDHIGAVPYLMQQISAPIYGTRLTLGLIQSRLEEKPPAEKPVLIEVEPGSQVRIGGFLVDFLRVNHSIIDGTALAISTPVGVIIHTGDFKIDYSPVDGKVTDIFRFSEYGEKGVLLLMSDSTNAERKGYTRSESVLASKLFEIFADARGRIIVATFASNIHRIQQVLDAARKYNRKVVFSGTTMIKNVEIAKNLGYLTYKDNLVVDIKQAGSIPQKRLVVICTGSQGEPMSALARMSSGTHKNIMAGAGDTVIITASVIPGNERTVYTVINALMRMGADVFYEQDEDIHVSGHASQEELKLMISLTRPKFFLPIHGEYRHLRAHARLAESIGIPTSRILIAENGDVLSLTGKSFEKSGKIELSQVFVDGNEIEDISSAIITDRKSMSHEGIVVVTAVVSEGMLVRRPEVLARGFITGRTTRIVDMIRADAEEQAHKLLEDGTPAREIAIILKKNLKNHVYRLTRRNPLIEVLVLEV